MLRYITYNPNTTYYPPRPLPGAGIRSTFIYYSGVTGCFTVESPLTHLYMITSSVCYLTINYIHGIWSFDFGIILWTVYFGMDG